MSMAGDQTRPLSTVLIGIRDDVDRLRKKVKRHSDEETTLLLSREFDVKFAKPDINTHNGSLNVMMGDYVLGHLYRDTSCPPRWHVHGDKLKCATRIESDSSLDVIKQSIANGLDRNKKIRQREASDYHDYWKDPK